MLSIHNEKNWSYQGLNTIGKNLTDCNQKSVDGGRSFCIECVPVQFEDNGLAKERVHNV